MIPRCVVCTGGLVLRTRAAAAGPAATPSQQDLAAPIHLSGARAGAAYAVQGFWLTAGQQCGAHDVHSYLAQVNTLKRHFARLAAAG